MKGGASSLACCVPKNHLMCAETLPEALKDQNIQAAALVKVIFIGLQIEHEYIHNCLRLWLHVCKGLKHFIWLWEGFKLSCSQYVYIPCVHNS